MERYNFKTVEEKWQIFWDKIAFLATSNATSMVMSEVSINIDPAAGTNGASSLDLSRSSRERNSSRISEYITV